MTASQGKVDFAVKLFIFLLICGGLNHLRDIIQYGWAGRNTFLGNFTDATFTALPMCTFALLLIRHLHSLQKRLYLQATHDILTGLRNRRWFMDDTPEQLGPNQALFLIDLDNFKSINDTFGHDVGDQCLVQFAEQLRATLRSTDVCARVGGEEFAIFLRQADGFAVHEVAKRISAGVSLSLENGSKRRVTASVGVVLVSDEQTRADALKQADDAVYQAKSNGRACYVVAADDSASAHDVSMVSAV